MKTLLFHFFSPLLFAALYRQWGASRIEPITHPEWYIQVSPDVRASYLSRAILWEPRSISGITTEQVRLGEPTSLRADHQVSCIYIDKTRKELGGMSPKFECRLANGKIYRIKYGVQAHTTVAASRLLWALGFGAPNVQCKGCSSDPWKKLQPIHGENTFGEAVIQQVKEGREITLPGEAEVGWSWKNDLPLVSAKKEALRARRSMP